jgi:hypothetical protein
MWKIQYLLLVYIPGSGVLAKIKDILSFYFSNINIFVDINSYQYINSSPENLDLLTGLKTVGCVPLPSQFAGPSFINNKGLPNHPSSDDARKGRAGCSSLGMFDPSLYFLAEGRHRR